MTQWYLGHFPVKGPLFFIFHPFVIILCQVILVLFGAFMSFSGCFTSRCTCFESLLSLLTLRLCLASTSTHFCGQQRSTAAAEAPCDVDARLGPAVRSGAVRCGAGRGGRGGVDAYGSLELLFLTAENKNQIYAHFIVLLKLVTQTALAQSSPSHAHTRTHALLSRSSLCPW